MQLISASDYYQALLRDIPVARRRVVLAAMVVAEGEAMHHIFEQLEAAARRGVVIHILVDIYTKHWLAKIPKMARWVVTRATFDQLEQAGGRVSYYDRVGLNPVAGRCHVKVSVIDDAVYSFGGVNLCDIAFENVDYMVKTTDAALADRLVGLVDDIAAGRAAVDAQMPLSHGELLYDGGQPHTSIIYERAVELTRQAKQIYYVSQFGPSGRFAPLVKATDGACYYNRVWQMMPPGNVLLIRDKIQYGLHNRYHRPAYIHAKFILFELMNGTKALLAGSNNFNWDAVSYGTKEIALYSTNEELWQQFYVYLQQEVA